VPAHGGRTGYQWNVGQVDDAEGEVELGLHCPLVSMGGCEGGWWVGIAQHGSYLSVLGDCEGEVD
jgi:hypothetical protein